MSLEYDYYETIDWIYIPDIRLMERKDTADSKIKRQQIYSY